MAGGGCWLWQSLSLAHHLPRLDFAFPQFSIRTTKDIILVGIIAALSFFHSLTQTNTCGRCRDIILYTDNTITFNKHYHCLNELFWEKIEKFPNNSFSNLLAMSPHIPAQTTHQDWWVLFLHKIPNWNEWKPLVSKWLVCSLISQLFLSGDLSSRYNPQFIECEWVETNWGVSFFHLGY